MKKVIYLLLLLLISSQFILCSKRSWDIEHSISDEINILTPEQIALLNEEFSSSPNDRTVSRTSGVAPLAVHFFADFVGSVSGDERIDRFHHYDYTWDFGDEGSGVWGTTGKSRNTAKGANAAHIYETAGEYDVTLTIRDHDGIVDTENYSVQVSNPEEVYSGTNTTCVNNDGDIDFSEAPSGCKQISTNDLSTVTQYATAGSRILFKRGSSWTVSESLNWPSNSGPVTIGAYGSGTQDIQGIYNNAPRIMVANGSFFNLSYKQNWRIMDLHLVDATGTNESFTGAISMQRQLFFRLKIEGFNIGLGWSHWNSSVCMPKDDMVIALCNISGSYINVLYVGSERLALLGNIISNAQQTHVVRVWQAYRSVISNNIISGSSLTTSLGSHALKFHGPGIYPEGEGSASLGVPVEGTGLINVKTQFSIISNNIFGASGPWPVAIGPQNLYADERLSNLIFEQNSFHSDYGSQSSILVSVSLNLWARYCTIRNNIFDGTGGGNSYCAMVLQEHGVMPPPSNLEVYHNTIYRGDSALGAHLGIRVGGLVTSSILQNNLVSFPYATGPVTLIDDRSADLVSSNNLLTDNALFVFPDAVNPLDRDFSLQPGSPAIDAGVEVPVYEDMDNNTRPVGNYDIGAYEN